MNITSRRYESYAEVQGKFFIPSIQRDLMPVQVSKMREHIRERHLQGKDPIFGSLDIVIFNNQMWCVDGQHRLRALELEYTENKSNIPFICVIYPADSKEEIQLIFKTRNLGIPLPEYLLSTDNNTKLELLKEIQRNISAKKGFDISKKSRPHINIGDFMNILSSSQIINILTDINDFNIMYEYINESNKQLISDEKYRKRNKISENMIKKWHEFGNYLGIDLNFPKFSSDDANLELIESILRNRAPTNIINNVSNSISESESVRKKFSQIERQQVWHTYIGAHKGRVLCPLCKANNIEPLNYTIGHVISLHNGGTNDISNLRAICSICNNSMGTKNMNLNNYNLEGI